MKNADRRHDISDQTWDLLEPLLPDRRGEWSGIAKEQVKNAILHLKPSRK